MEKLWPALQHVNSSSYDYALKAAEHLGITDQVRADIVKIVSADKSPGMLVKDVLGRHLDLRKIE